MTTGREWHSVRAVCRLVAGRKSAIVAEKQGSSRALVAATLCVFTAAVNLLRLSDYDFSGRVGYGLYTRGASCLRTETVFQRTKQP
jgi:hypothetical protein